MIIITGLGRCGTSFFLNIFKGCGFGIGKSLSWNPKVNAGMELSFAYAISRDMYDGYLKKGKEIDLDEKLMCQYWGREISFREKILMIDNDTPPKRNEGIVEVIKDPRVTWHPKIIRSWWQVRQDIKLIILHREPEDVIKSREKAGLKGYGNDMKFQDPKRGKILDIFKIDFSDFITEVMRLEIPHLLMFYPNFMRYDSHIVYSKLYNTFGIDMNSKGNNFTEVWDNIFDETKMSTFENERT